MIATRKYRTPMKHVGRENGQYALFETICSPFSRKNSACCSSEIIRSRIEQCYCLFLAEEFFPPKTMLVIVWISDNNFSDVYKLTSSKVLD